MAITRKVQESAQREPQVRRNQSHLQLAHAADAQNETKNRATMIARLVVLFEAALRSMKVVPVSPEALEYVEAASLDAWHSAGRMASGRQDYVPSEATRAGVLEFFKARLAICAEVR